MLEALLRERAGLVANMRSMVEEAESRGGMTSEDRSAIDKIDTEIEALDARISTLRKLEGYEASLRGAETQTEQPEIRTGGLSEAEYRSVFEKMVRGLPLDQDEARALRVGYVAEEARDMSVGVNAQGGYVAPDEFEKKLLSRVEELSTVRQLVGKGENYLSTGHGNMLTFPREVGRGAAAWLDEGAAFVASDDSFDTVSIEAWKAGRLVKVTLELVEDSFFDILGYLATSCGIAIAELEQAAFVNGDGVKKPRGFLQTAQSALTASGTIANAFTTNTAFDEITDLVYAVRPSYRSRSKFIVSESLVKRLRKIKDNDGRLIWQDSVREGEQTTLLGFGVHVEPNMPSIAANSKSIAFGDFSQYMIRDVAGVRVARLGERYLADEGKIGYLAWHRTDGELLDPAAVKVITAPAA